MRMLKFSFAFLVTFAVVMFYYIWITDKYSTGDVFSQPSLGKVVSNEIETRQFSSTIKFTSQNLQVQFVTENNGSDTLKDRSEVASRDPVRPLINLDLQDVDVEELSRRLVVVTAFSENHRLEVMGMIGTVQNHMPATRVIAYDLGIDPRYLSKLRRLCNLEVRPFEFHRYPSHVSVLMKFAWKPIIIKEALNEFGVIFWADASVRFQDSLITLLPFAKEHHGYFSKIHSYTPLSAGSLSAPALHNFFLTHRKMFAYFGIKRKRYAKSPNTPHVAANRQLVINSTTVQEKVIKPLYACAMDENCIGPPGAVRGNHMFDASALLLIFYKYWPREFNRDNDHVADMDRVTRMHRESDDWSQAKLCEV
ncbi:uncharacterized protein LOC110977006 isoform X2 [Acanthaster planci]|nr:uncharacterized protein LOC110977006 isoform X2 [Acanthaster planci]